MSTLEIEMEKLDMFELKKIVRDSDFPDRRIAAMNQLLSKMFNNAYHMGLDDGSGKKMSPPVLGRERPLVDQFGDNLIRN